MQRRTLLKQMLYTTGGLLLLPSCLQQKSNASLLLKNISVDGNEESLVAELCETILPATDTPGAKDVSAHLFVLKMVDDCYKKDDQQKFIQGLQAFEAAAKKEFGKAFTALSPAERQTMLNELERKKDDKEAINIFYAIAKKHTIQAYTTSKFYLTKVQVYELVPGRYHGCVPVKKLV